MNYNILGVTLDWAGYPTITYEADGKKWILPKAAEQIIFEKYYSSGDKWPRDPSTGEKLSIWRKP